MAEIGVLELEIKDNAGSAGEGLEKLAGALVRVKEAVGKSFGLGNVAKAVKGLHTSISEATGTGTTIKNITSLFNALSNLSKIKKIDIDTSSLDNIKQTFSGFNLNNSGTQLEKFQKALAKDWDLSKLSAASTELPTAVQGIVDAVNTMESNDVTGKLTAAGKAIKAYAESYASIPKSTAKMSNILDAGTQLKDLKEAFSSGWSSTGAKTAMQGVVDIANQFSQNGTASKLAEVAKAMKDYAKAYESLPSDAKGKMAQEMIDSAVEVPMERRRGSLSLNLQQFGGKGSGRRKKQAEDQLPAALSTSANEAVVQVQSNLQKATDATRQFNVQLSESKDIITSIAVNNFDDMYKQFSELSYELGWFKKETLRLGEGDTTYWNAMREGTEKVCESLGEMNKYLENSTTLADRLAMSVGNITRGTSIIPYTGESENKILEKAREYAEYTQFHAPVPDEHMLSTYVDYSEQWAPNWAKADESISVAEVATQAISENLGTMNSYLESSATLAERIAMSLGNLSSAGTPNSMSIIPYTGMQEHDVLGNSKRYTEDAYFNQSTAPENMLSTWVDYSEQFKTNWVYFYSDVAEGWRNAWSPDWIMGGWENVPDRLSHLLIGPGNNVPLLGDGGVSPENMLSTWVDRSDVFSTGWTNGSNFKPDFEMVGDAYATITNEAGEAEEINARIVDGIAEASAAELEYKNHIEEVCAAKRAEAELAEKIKTNQQEEFYKEKEPVSMDVTNKMADNLTQLDLMKAKLVEAEQKYNEFVNTLGAGASKTIQQGLTVSGLRDKIWEYTSSMQEAQQAEEESTDTTSTLESAIRGLGSAFDNLKTGIKKMFPALTGMMSRFGNLIKYRALRAVIKHLADGFKEGWENLKGYKQAIGDDFANSINNANAQLLTMKNSIGAAVAPAFQALLPILNSIVSAVITVINWVNQLISLLTGKSTWTKATEASAESLDNVKKSAGGASSAVKDLLADWDELNIIQSESGGGGGGGGAGKQAADYASMFEEVNEFDEKIKEIVGFIDEHMGGILRVAELIGIAILGWKISKAFGGVLGQLGRLAAGITISILGFELSEGAGYEAGKKGEYGIQEIIESALGAVASAVGGLLLFGPAGAVIALGVAVVLNFLGFERGKADRIDSEKWGDLHLTQEEIEKYVKEQFTFDVDATVNLLQGHIENEHSARDDLNTQIEQFSKSLEEAKANVALNVDSEITSASVIQASADALDAITNVQALIDASNAGLTFTLKNFAFKDDEGKDISDEILSSIKIADTVLSDYFTGIGEQISQLILEGEKSGWKNGEAEQALELMESQRRIYEKAAEARADMETNAKIRQSVNHAKKNGIFDKESAQAALEEQKNILKEVQEKTEAQAAELATNWAYMASLARGSAEEAGLDTEAGRSLTAAAEIYEAKAAQVLDGMQKAVDDKLAETKANMAKEWIEALKAVYGEDFIKDISKFATDQQPIGLAIEWIDNWIGAGRSTESQIKKLVKESGYEGAAEYFKQAIADTLIGSDPNGIAEFVLKDLGGNVMDFITDEMKNQIISDIRKNAGDDEIAFGILQNMFHMDKATLSKYFGSEFTSDQLWNAAQGEIGDAVKNHKDVGVRAGEFGANMADFKGTVKEELEQDLDMGEMMEVNAEYTVKAKLNDPEDVSEQIKSEILAAMEDGVMSTIEGLSIIEKYGPDLFNQMMEELQLNLDEEGMNRGMVLNPKQFTASAGVSDVGFGSYAPVATGAEEITVEDSNVEVEFNTEEMSTGVQSGTREGFANVVSALNALLTALNNKNFSVNISPSSDWGFFNQQSGNAAGNVTGEG